MQWALAAGVQVTNLFIHERSLDDPLVQLARFAGVALLVVTEGISKKISNTGYVVPFIGVADPSNNIEDENDLGPFTIVIDRVVDHGNIGTIVRTASAFGIGSLVLTDPLTDLYYPKTVTASRGRVFHVRALRTGSGVEAVNRLRRGGYQIMGTSADEGLLVSLVPIRKRPIALVMGNERNGIEPDALALTDAVVRIPIASDVDSLNVATAAGICMYELKRRQVSILIEDFLLSDSYRRLLSLQEAEHTKLSVKLRSTAELDVMQLLLMTYLGREEDYSLGLVEAARAVGKSVEDAQSVLEQLTGKRYVRVTDESNGGVVSLTRAGELALTEAFLLISQASPPFAQ